MNANNGEQLLLVEKLVEATRAGKIAWTETFEDDTFRCLLDHGLVRISPATRVTGEPAYRLVILNRQNTEVENLLPSSDPEAALYRELFELARQSALRPDRVLKGLLDEVRGKLAAELANTT
jgi:hypothetical protein